MQVVSLIWGIVVLLGGLVAAIPFLGWLNWLNIPVAVIGLAVSIVVRGKAPQNQRGLATAGLALCSAACALGVMRLYLGGGLL
jgi:hypothetical protein